MVNIPKIVYETNLSNAGITKYFFGVKPKVIYDR